MDMSTNHSQGNNQGNHSDIVVIPENKLVVKKQNTSSSVIEKKNQNFLQAEYIFEESKFDLLYRSNRDVLIDWLVQIHAELKMSQEELFTAVSILDRYHEKAASNNQ